MEPISLTPVWLGLAVLALVGIVYAYLIDKQLKRTDDIAFHALEGVTLLIVDLAQKGVINASVNPIDDPKKIEKLIKGAEK